MTSGKPTVTGGNRKQSEVIPAILPEDPEDRHCCCLVETTKSSVAAERVIPVAPDSDETKSHEPKSPSARTFRFIVILVYLLTSNFRFTPITSLLISPPRFAARWCSERVFSL